MATIALGLLLALMGAGRISDSRVDTIHPNTAGKILEAKIVMDHSSDSPYGGKIFYRIDARANYEIDGKTYDRWLQASDVTTSKEILEAKLVQHPTRCQVFWSEGDPGSARCRI